MRLRSTFAVLTLLFQAPAWAQLQHSERLKRRVIHYVDSRANRLTEIADRIWTFAEPPLEEIKSAGLLKDVLRENGFLVKENLCGFKTVFMATYGSEGPVIGLFGEYDSDAGAANQVVPHRATETPAAYGHGGHHNLLGTGSLGAALSLSDLIREGRLKCTIRYYGTSDEGGVGTKSYLARDGYFDDLDISLYWHPAPVTAASTSHWDARLNIQVLFTCPTVNVLFGMPGSNNTLTAAERFVHELALIRSTMSPTKRLNYDLNMNNRREMIGDSAVFELTIQTAHQADVNQLLSSLTDGVDRISSETGVKGVLRVLDAKHEFLPNVSAMRAVYDNMVTLPSEIYSKEEQQFVKILQAHIGENVVGIHDQLLPFKDQSGRESLYGHASDIGDASWIAPEIYFVVQTLPSVPMHQWPATIFSGHSIGQRGMLRAAKILAMTVIDYVRNEGLQQAIRTEFNDTVGNYQYRFLMSVDSP